MIGTAGSDSMACLATMSTTSLATTTVAPKSRNRCAREADGVPTALAVNGTAARLQPSIHTAVAIPLSMWIATR